MLLTLAEIAVAIIGLYSLIGLLFAVVFVSRGVRRIDPAAENGSLGFRILIIPGSIALWPILLRRWRRGAPPPEERNSHRDLSHRGETS